MPSLKSLLIEIPPQNSSNTQAPAHSTVEDGTNAPHNAAALAQDDDEELDELVSPFPDQNNDLSPIAEMSGGGLAEMSTVEGAGGLPISGAGENAFIKFQLIPISETPGKSAVGEVVERSLKEKDVIKLGRQVIRDGQATIKGNKKATEKDIWLTSKVVSRLHAEIWTKDGQLCVKDVGSSSGTFLNQMRLSPSGKESRPYPLKQGDVLQFGVDFKGKTEDVYRAVTLKLGFHDQSWLKAQRKNANGPKFSSALKQLIAATNPYSEKKDTEESEAGDTDCCICIGPIAPFQALFIAPCSHCYHYKCVGYLVAQSPMFQCPLCRQVANLTASVSSESLNANSKIVVPLPILEDELPTKPKDAAPIPSFARRPSQRSSFSGAKRIMENLGLLSPRAYQGNTNSNDIPDPQNQGSSSGEVSRNSTTVKQRASVGFKFRFGSKTTDKEKEGSFVPRTGGASLTQSPSISPDFSSVQPPSPAVPTASNSNTDGNELNILAYGNTDAN